MLVVGCPRTQDFGLWTLDFRLQPPRLGQSGPLNGEQYSIRRDYATPAVARPPDAKSSINPLQTKGISRSTSDRYRTSAGPLRKQQACPTRCASLNESGRAHRTRLGIGCRLLVGIATRRIAAAPCETANPRPHPSPERLPLRPPGWRPVKLHGSPGTWPAFLLP
jgi:hypothetical protein